MNFVAPDLNFNAATIKVRSATRTHIQVCIHPPYFPTILKSTLYIVASRTFLELTNPSCTYSHLAACLGLEKPSCTCSFSFLSLDFEAQAVHVVFTHYPRTWKPTRHILSSRTILGILNPSCTCSLLALPCDFEIHAVHS